MQETILKTAKSFFQPEVDITIKFDPMKRKYILSINLDYEEMELTNIDKTKVFVDNKIIHLIEASFYYQGMERLWKATNERLKTKLVQQELNEEVLEALSKIKKYFEGK